MPDDDWKELLLGQVEARIDRSDDGKRPYRDVRVRMPLSAVGSLYEACAARDMSASAYGRRAILAFAAFDLGLNLKDLLRHEPQTRVNGQPPATLELLAGEGHGEWRIGSLS